MDKNKKALYDLMENYFYYCEHEGLIEFEMWCKDNFDNEEQENLMYKMKHHVDTIAELLFDI